MAELITCPECKKHLQVPDELLGKRVQCPECKHTFTAEQPDYSAPAKTSTTTAPPPPLPENATPEWDKKDSRSSSSKRRGDDSYGAADRDDDDDDDRPRRRRRRSMNRYDGTPHRGGMILAFGLISLLMASFFPVGLIFALMAWFMGNADLAEIRSGRMDPEGEGMTQAGRIMGIISTIIHILSILACCGYFACVFAFVGLAAPGGRPPPRRF
jgi:predicted Zn finger-like uncharacterized protein